MDLDLKTLIDVVRHLDKHLDQLTRDYGTWTYAILAAIVFCETGLVVLPFLPGDSLLFAAGAVSVRDGSGLDPMLLGGILIVCAIAGDTVNYHVGKAIGPRVMKHKNSRWLNPKHLDKTHRFFEKYGGKTIILARFVPIVRTFAPFVAGIGKMSYPKFLAFNLIGAVAWVLICVLAGWWFGNLEIVRRNFELVLIAIIGISVLPMAIEFLRARRAARPSAPVA